jgi:hypothetical protein
MSVCEIPKHNFSNVICIPLNLEVILQVALDNVQEPSSIFFIHQSVVKNSLRFMSPQTDQSFFIVEEVILNRQYALENLTQVSQVECVMGFCWSGKELCSDLLVNLE